MSVGVRSITSGLRTKISRAKTTKVYGRLSASLTIHIFDFGPGTEPHGNGLGGTNQSGNCALSSAIQDDGNEATTLLPGSHRREVWHDHKQRTLTIGRSDIQGYPLIIELCQDHFSPAHCQSLDSEAIRLTRHPRYFCFATSGNRRSLTNFGPLIWRRIVGRGYFF